MVSVREGPHRATEPPLVSRFVTVLINFVVPPFKDAEIVDPVSAGIAEIKALVMSSFDTTIIASFSSVEYVSTLWE